MLTQKEKLQCAAESLRIDIYEALPDDSANDGLYLGKKGRGIILMKRHLPDSKYIPVLAEEIGHHYASHGIVVELCDVPGIKSENQGRAWAIEFLLPICKFAFASVMHGCKTPADFAEAFSLDVAFVQAAICFHQRRGIWPASFDSLFSQLAKPNYETIWQKQRFSYGKSF